MGVAGPGCAAGGVARQFLANTSGESAEPPELDEANHSMYV
jgi:hypothetical protein